MTYAINPTVAFATTIEEQVEAVSFLPNLSVDVLSTLLDLLYAEAGFSDVEVADIASTMGVPVGMVAGAVGYLVEHGLVQIDDTTVNNRKRRFVFIAGTLGGDDRRPALRKAVKARMTNGRAKKARPSTTKVTKVKKAKTPAPNFWLKAADQMHGNGRVEVYAEDAATARQKAVRDGFKVTGRAYPIS